MNSITLLQSKKSDIIKQCGCKTEHGCGKCSAVISMLYGFDLANIPVSYWFKKVLFENPLGDKGIDFTHNTINKYIKNKDEVINSGKSLFFCGQYGLGKTTFGTFILKEYVKDKYIHKKNYNVYYTTLEEVLRNRFDRQFLEKVFAVDLLFFDEIDSRHTSSSDEAQKMLGETFEKIIRFRSQNKRATIIASNHDDIASVFMNEQFKRVATSITSNFIKLQFLGKDKRIKR